MTPLPDVTVHRVFVHSGAMTRSVPARLLLGAAFTLALLFAPALLGQAAAQEPGGTTVAPDPAAGGTDTTVPAATGPRFIATITVGDSGETLEGV